MISPGVEGGVAAAAGGGLSDVAGAPPLLVAAVVGDLEDAALVEVEPASLAFQALQVGTTQSLFTVTLQSGWSGCRTGNGEKLSNSHVCCLAQLCLAAA